MTVDDWAHRKRHSYGTVLIDLERRRPVTLLPDREADTLAQWLRDHPGVKIIAARDRAGAYADGARRGAPKAVQVADRFHLLQNLVETVEIVFTAHAAALRAVEPASTQGGAVRPAPPHRPTTVRAKAAERRERRRARHQQVWTLRRKSWSEHAIARHLGIGRSTVFCHLRHETFPERKGRSDAGQSLLDPWKPTILDRWNAGCRHSWRLFRDLQRQGYRGSYPTLARYTHHLRQAQEEAAAQQPPPKRVLPPVMDPPERPLTQRTAAWLILRHPDHRTAAETERLGWLRAQDPALAEATDLASDFIDLVRRRQIERLDPWLARAQSCALPAFRGFAKGLCTAYDAVRAAVTLPWGTGPVEGQINRLKMIKRQMYNRANLDLLNRRFLLAA